MKLYYSEEQIQVEGGGRISSHNFEDEKKNEKHEEGMR